MEKMHGRKDTAFVRKKQLQLKGEIMLWEEEKLTQNVRFVIFHQLEFYALTKQ